MGDDFFVFTSPGDDPLGATSGQSILIDESGNIAQEGPGFSPLIIDIGPPKSAVPTLLALAAAWWLLA